MMEGGSFSGLNQIDLEPLDRLSLYNFALLWYGRSHISNGLISGEQVAAILPATKRSGEIRLCARRRRRALSALLTFFFGTTHSHSPCCSSVYFRARPFASRTGYFLAFSRSFC